MVNNGFMALYIIPRFLMLFFSFLPIGLLVTNLQTKRRDKTRLIEQLGEEGCQEAHFLRQESLHGWTECRVMGGVNEWIMYFIYMNEKERRRGEERRGEARRGEKPTWLCNRHGRSIAWSNERASKKAFGCENSIYQ